MQSVKQAILVVSFGTSYHETCEKTIAAIERKIEGFFPEWTIRRAFTSGMIIRKLKERDNIAVDNVDEALERLASEGYTKVICQPTHVINGEEYFDIVEDAQKHSAKFESFAIGKPLLTDSDDYDSLARIVSDSFPAEKSRAYCLMGHGTTHFADSSYAALEYRFNDIGREDIFVATVEGYPDIETVIRNIKKSDAKKITLAPLMIVAGDHAQNDMAGDHEDSWKVIFENEGYEVDCVVKGLGEYDEVAQIYVDHLRKAIGANE